MLYCTVSRARGDATERSDWDIGVLAADPPALLALSAAFTEILGTEEVDLVGRVRCSATARRDGIALVERPSGAFQRFQLDAVQFW